MKQPLKIFWIALGFICLALGTIGIALPILPTVPFYMATVFCFVNIAPSAQSKGESADK